ncbi:endothelin-converting enzyme homolog isoform X2 [Argiope bruennichi]|uniref:endothelin-converting enzyme homolog isoform X2 n=1 Tax=Argiope bruennichi TaxID=94029 RepID=UPI002493F79B|nr:endothelin-converting enzyme homolog isoform X2 [Argiope bruennichi]
MDANERTRLHQISDQENSCTITTTLEKRLLVILIICIAVALGLIIALAANAKGGWKKSLANENSNVCFSTECISTAARLLHSMDLNEDPCEDFYSFVCGNWIKNTFLVGDISTQFTQLNSIIYLRIKEVLETSHGGLAEHENKTQKFYKSCMNFGSRDETGSKVLKKDLEKFGSWPLIEKSWKSEDFNWTDLLVDFYENGYPVDMLFSIGIDMDIKRTSTSLISVNQPTLGFSDKTNYVLDKPLKRYKELIYEIALHLSPGLDRATAMKDITNAMEIEIKLAKAAIARIHSKKPEVYYNIMTLKELEEFAPKIAWRYLLPKFLPPKTKLQDDQRFMVTVPVALKTLNDILKNDTSKGKNLANYMFYRAAVFAAEHLERDLFYLVEDKLHRSSRRDLWQVCVGATMDFFHMSLTATYAESYLDEKSKYNLEMMFQGIQVSLLDEIKEAKWLDEETRQKALVKVKKVRSTIAYREEIKDEEKLNDYYSAIEIGDDHFSNVKAALAFKTKEGMKGLEGRRFRLKWSDVTSVLTANAFYLPNRNSIILPIGLLQDTFFSSGRPNYINYGSLGTILGHEYTHAFDNAGSLYDEDGNYRKWWTSQSWENFHKKTKCFEKQYNEYYEPKVDSLVNGTITLGENIADNGGLLSSFAAYQKLLKQIGKEEKLPGLPFTERQMFWIAFASVWCRKQTDHSLEYTIENSVHAPAKFRVNGALSNVEEFSKDFKCETGSTLNPKSKCSLWT